MTRRDAVSPDALQPDESTNLSLWLDRYATGFDQEMLRQHHSISLDRIHVPQGYRVAFARRERALGEFVGDYTDGETRLYNVVLTGRAVIGIGMASVRETNLSLLRPWGVPLIPGSALKGLASHVAHELGGEWHRPIDPGKKAGALQRALFGDVTSAGAVVFHDAWWKPGGDRMPIHADAMTVHHAKYYQGTDAPADWDEPNPVSFLAASGTYLAALTGPGDALDVVDEFLRNGLSSRGIGAKTAAGYGRADFERHVSDITRQLRDFMSGAAAANTVQQHAQAFLRLAGLAGLSEEQRIAMQVAKRMVAASAAVWKKWLDNSTRTPEERRWFAIELETLAPVTHEPTAAPAPMKDPKTEVRRVRVKYLQDRKAAARYLLRIEGEAKDIKGHLIVLGPEDLDRIKASGEDGALMDLEYENGRLKLRSAK